MHLTAWFHHFLLMLMVHAMHISADNVIAAKSKSSITFAIVGPYGAIPGVKLDGPLVASGLDDPNLILKYSGATFSYLEVIYWEQLFMKIAISHINQNPDVFPDTAIKVKVFNNLQVTKRGLRTNLGYELALAMEIQDKHSDVVAILGGTNYMTGEMRTLYKVPSCGVGNSYQGFTDRKKYGYYISTQSYSGYARPVTTLLTAWGVSRVAILTDSGSSDIVAELNEHGIRILTKININKNMSPDEIKSIGKLLQHYDSRYIILDAGSAVSGIVYYALASLGLSVGNQYVWITFSAFLPVPNGQQLFGVDYLKLKHGVITIQSRNPTPANIQELEEAMVLSLNNLLSPTGQQFDATHFNPYNGPAAYDCAQVLATGIYSVLANNSLSPQILGSKMARNLLNSTAFRNTGYRGFTGDPVVLSNRGDINAPIIVAYYNENGSTVVFGTFAKNNRSQQLILLPGAGPVFRDGSSVPPDDGRLRPPPIQMISSSSRAVFVFRFYACAGYVLCFSYALLLICFRKVKAVRAGSVTFSFVHIIGALLLYISTELKFDLLTEQKCAGIVWLHLLGYTLIVSSSIVKNARIYLIYSGNKFSKERLSDLYSLRWMCVPVLGEVILLTVWTVLSDLQIQPQYNEDNTTLTCIYDSSTGSILERVLTAFNVLIYAFLLVVTHKLRYVAEIHSEFTYLVSLEASATVAMLIATTMKHFGKASATSYSLTETTLIWLITTQSILSPLISKSLAVFYEVADSRLKWSFSRSTSRKSTAVKDGTAVKVSSIKSVKGVVESQIQNAGMMGLVKASSVNSLNSNALRKMKSGSTMDLRHPELPSAPKKTASGGLEGKSESMASLNKAKTSSFHALNTSMGDLTGASKHSYGAVPPKKIPLPYTFTSKYGFECKFHVVYKLKTRFLPTIWTHAWACVGCIGKNVVILLLPQEDDDAPTTTITLVNKTYQSTTTCLAYGSRQQHRIKLKTGKVHACIDFEESEKVKQFLGYLDKYCK